MKLCARMAYTYIVFGLKYKFDTPTNMFFIPHKSKMDESINLNVSAAATFKETSCAKITVVQTRKYAGAEAKDA